MSGDEIDYPKVGNGWTRYQELVMETLEMHGKRLDLMDEKLTNIRIEIATLKGKATAWGAVAGMICGTIMAIIADLVARITLK
jgi:tetrahydromethanopterin S-methyltransferase subunit G